MNKQRVRSRTFIGASGGGAPCNGSLTEATVCSRKMDCGMGAWTAWSACDVTCGTGQRQRHRQIVNSSREGGMLCQHSLVMLKPCNEQKNFCTPRKDCVHSAWRDWTYCTTTCGVGQKVRQREIISNRSLTGKGCQETTLETRPCKNRPSCVLDCKWGLWSDWSHCSKQCGGGWKIRHRSIDQAPNGGMNMLERVCAKNSGEELRACNKQACDPHSNNTSKELCINGEWNDWGPWGVCTSSCSESYTMRQRTVKIEANYCGVMANGNVTEVKRCEQKACFVDCIFGQWGVWGACSASCDGVMVRSRGIAQESDRGGKFCEGPLKQMAPCNNASTVAGCPQHQKPPPVDCKVGAWSNFTVCSRTCGGGQMTRERQIIEPARNGGSCETSLTETAACASGIAHLCVNPPIDCQWNDWGEWGLCDKCSGQRHRHRSINASAAWGGKPCLLTSTSEITKCTRHCTANSLCVWADWEPWTACSRTCGNGTRERLRSLKLIPKPIGSNPYDVVTKYDENIEDKVHQLYRENNRMQARHNTQLVISFVGGGALIFVVFLVSQTFHTRSAANTRSLMRETSSTSRSRRQTETTNHDVLQDSSVIRRQSRI
jgi:hypothetical protein